MHDKHITNYFMVPTLRLRTFKVGKEPWKPEDPSLPCGFADLLTTLLPELGFQLLNLGGSCLWLFLAIGFVNFVCL